MHARTHAAPLSLQTLLLTAALFAAAIFACSSRADASANLCAAGVVCTQPPDFDRTLTDVQLRHAAGTGIDSDVLSDQEFYSFSGVGVIACTIDGKQHTSTAFLVGAFDIGVTVGHTF